MITVAAVLALYIAACLPCPCGQCGRPANQHTHEEN
ncbi:hypothetical protein BX265_6132 [Streptomyces sp. TLI_235]|nr:hypothetical protein BX265_6132 [Streptomyces sp. TLI_235]